MYVWSQGRRIKRREAALRFPGDRDTETGNDLDRLVGQSLALWDAAEARIEGLERTWHAARRDGLSPTEHGASGLHLPVLRTGSVPRNDLVTQEAQTSKTKELQSELRHMNQQLEDLRKKNRQLEMQLFDSVAQRKRLQQDLKVCKEQAQSHTRTEISRKFRFIQASNHLLSTSAPESIDEVSDAVQPRTVFYEVKVPQFQIRPDLRPTEREDVAKLTRLAYTEAPSKALFAEHEVDSQIDPAVVAQWLLEVEPRTYTDAGVLLILAKDILRRLVTSELQFYDSEKSKNEAKVIELQYILDNLSEKHDGEIKQKEQEMEDLRKSHLKELNEVHEETGKRISLAKRDAVALKMKNMGLQVKVNKVKDFYQEVKAGSPLEQMKDWTVPQKIEVLKKLLQEDRVNFHLPEDFAVSCAISDSSMLHWCQQFLRALESKHAGTRMWLQMACDVFMTSPQHFAKKVHGWYRNGNPEALSPEDRAALASLEGGPEGELQVMRQDLHSGKLNIWEVASVLLQVPKESAMAELLGFREEDEEAVLALWPDFLLWFQRHHSQHRLAPPPPALARACQALEGSGEWERLAVRAHGQAFGLLEAGGAEERGLGPEESGEVMASIYGHRHQQQHQLDPFFASDAAFPDFVRMTLLKKHSLRSFAGKNLGRLQRSVLDLHVHSARARVFGKLSGMVHPLRYYECSEGFVLCFWGHLMAADRDAQRQRLGRQDSMWPQAPPAASALHKDKARERQHGLWPGDDSTGFKTPPRARISESQSGGAGGGQGGKDGGKSVASWSGAGAGWRAERSTLMGEQEEVGVQQALGRWMRSDRAVRAVDVVTAARRAMAEKLLHLPGCRPAPSEQQLRRVIAPAAVKAPRGTRLPLNDLDKTAPLPPQSPGAAAVGRGLGGRGDGTATVSLDMASDMLLDAWYQQLRGQEEFLCQLWLETDKIWDWGANGKSPDLDQLRLFIGIKCGLALREDDLCRLYASMSDHRNSIDPRDSAPALLRALYRGRPFVPVKPRKAQRHRSFRLRPTDRQPTDTAPAPSPGDAADRRRRARRASIA